jgi:transposase
MEPTDQYIHERLDHLGIVAGVCQEIGLAAWLDAQDQGNRQQVSVGTATVAMILNGLSFSNRQLYLVPQYFVNKPVEHLLGAGIHAEMLNDDCLGRTLDWVYARDPTKLFAGIASRARQIFGIKAQQIHVDTTSFSVSGQYAMAGEGTEPKTEAEHGPSEAAVIAITNGYSRDHREDLKQWMIALATTHDGDVPLFLQPLDGNSSDKVSLLAAMSTIQAQLREANAEPGIYVADSGVYSEANMRYLHEAGVKWVSRVPETSQEAKAVVQEGSDQWQTTEDGSMQWYSRVMNLPQGTERWLIVCTQASQQRAQVSFQRQVKTARATWERKCWHLGTRRFACEADARTALERELKSKPTWLEVRSDVVAHPSHAGKGRTSKDASPATHQWQIVATVTINQPRVEEEALRKACYILGTNVLDPQALSDQELVTTYKEQGGVERGFRFLKDQLFLAFSVFVKKPERIIALSLIMVLCLLVYRLAEYRLLACLAETEQTIPEQVHKHTVRQTMRWVCQCFEGIELLHVQTSTTSLTIFLRFESVHLLILALLGPLNEKIYHPSG